MLSTPFRASMRERPCAGDWTNGPRPPWSPAYRHAPRWAQTAHSSPKWLNGHQAALHAPTLPAVAVVSADAVHRVAYRGLLALASLSRRAAVVEGVARQPVDFPKAAGQSPAEAGETKPIPRRGWPERKDAQRSWPWGRASTHKAPNTNARSSRPSGSGYPCPSWSTHCASSHSSSAWAFLPSWGSDTNPGKVR